MRVVALSVLFGVGLLIGDELILKDGRRLRGTVEKEGSVYILRTKHGWVRVPARDVLEVAKTQATVRKAAKPAPPSFNSLFNNGMVLLERGRITDGKLLLLKALMLRPHDVRVWLKLGFVPDGKGWRYTAQRTEEPALDVVKPPTVPEGEIPATRALVEKGLDRLARRVRRRSSPRLTIPCYPPPRPGWYTAPYLWGWRRSYWRGTIWFPIGTAWLPVYRGNRVTVVVTGGEDRNDRGDNTEQDAGAQPFDPPVGRYPLVARPESGRSNAPVVYDPPVQRVPLIRRDGK